MRRFTRKLTIAIFTFLCGVTATSFWRIHQRSLSETVCIDQAENYRLLSIATKVNDWDKSVGPVQSIHVEIAKFFPDSNGTEKWSEQRRTPFQTSDFDREGRKIKEVQYRSDFTEKSPTGYIEGPPVTYSYDDNGRLTKDHVYSVYGRVCVETAYTYDPSGRLIGEIEQNIEDGKTLGRKTYRYSPETEYVDVEEYDWDDHLRSKIRYLIKRQERVIELIAPDEPHRGRLTISIDKAGNVLEAVAWLPDGKRGKEIYNYEFDSSGNWTKQLRSEQIIENGRIITKPRDATYRTIKYY